MERTYDSLHTYINLAKNTISKFGPKFYNTLSSEMLSSPDAIADVATAIMYADWRFDPNRVGSKGHKKTKYSYRNQCALWAIKTYVTNKYKTKNKNVSLDYSNDEDSNQLNSNIVDPTCQQPYDILVEKEEKQDLQYNIEKLLNCERLSDKQRKQIKMYYFDDMTLAQIGKVFNVSREAIRQNIKRGLEILKSYDVIET